MPTGFRVRETALMGRAGVAAVVVLAALPGCTATPDPPRPAPSAISTPGLAWQRLAPPPSARTEVAATVLGPRVYLAGGYRADGGTVATVEVLDTATRIWTTAPDLPLPVNHAMAATMGSAVHVFGGYRADGAPSERAYRLGPQGWSRIADLPEGRAAGTAVAAGDTVYIAGGIGPGGALATQMLAYAAGTDSWSILPGPPTPREHLGGAALGGRVYTVAGRTRSAGNLAAFEAYDPATRQWTKLPDVPTPRGGLAAAASCQGHVVAVGGEAATTFEEVEAYDVRAGAWRSLPPLPTPRHGLGVVTVGPVLYVLAGGPEPGLHVADAAEALDLSPLGPCPSST